MVLEIKGTAVSHHLSLFVFLFLKKFEFFIYFLLQINIFLVVLDYFNALMSKIIF
jgi:hypothetical protein